MREDRCWRLMSKYVSNDLSLEETEELLGWLGSDRSRAELLKEFQDVWDISRNYPENFRVNTKAAWQRLTCVINVDKHSRRITSLLIYKYLAFTAILILILVLVFLLLRFSALTAL